jgi:hypothetical protein
MKRIAFALILSAFAFATAQAQTCVSKALDKDGKPLAGAAKTSFVKRCCEASAVGKDGNPLTGAAKASYLTKCEKGG